MQTKKSLQKVGDRNRFQIYSILFVCLKWVIVSLTVFLPSYLFISPTFTCGDQVQISESQACDHIQSCQIDLPFSITAHAGLYCQNKYLRDSIISSEFIGSILGLVVLSILADKLGRKIIIIITLFIAFLGSIFIAIGAYIISLPLIYIGLMQMGFGGYSLTMVSYSYLSQINNDSWRQKSLVLTYSFWALGQITLYPIIKFIQNWQKICIFIFIIPFGVLILMSIFIVETPQFYYAKKEYKNCLKSLNYIAKFNGKQPIQQLIIEQQKQGQQKQTTKITHTFTKKKYLVPLIILSFAQACNNGLYYTTQYSINQIGYNFQQNMLIIGSLQLFTCLITNFYCQKMQRKKWIMIFMILPGVIGVIIQPIIQNSHFQILLIGLSRISNTFSFALFGLITTQSFPTSIRSTGIGISQALSNLGNMISPFLVTISDNIGVKAVFIGGFVCIVGGFSMFFVQETKKTKYSIEQNNLTQKPTESIQDMNQDQIIIEKLPNITQSQIKQNDQKQIQVINQEKEEKKNQVQFKK